jgi:hypothetical protein
MRSELNREAVPLSSSHDTSTSLAAERPTESNAIDIPQISLPQGGGALRGIDEQFAVNATNGTAALNLSLPFTPGRNGFAPSWQLRYNSAAGNEVYGLGWSINYPVLQRRTDRRLPRYTAEEADVFTFVGGEDLVPVLSEEDGWSAPPPGVDGAYRIRRYRPRIEGSFQRIERITHPDRGEYWRVTSRDNVVTFFGRNGAARLADPEDPERIFAWLPDFSFDDRGNWIEYVYKAEDLAGVPDAPHEHHRHTGLAPFTNRYLKRVRYGNRTPYFPGASSPYDPEAPTDTTCFDPAVMAAATRLAENAARGLQRLSALSGEPLASGDPGRGERR